jgi:hypothetical protein
MQADNETHGMASISADVVLLPGFQKGREKLTDFYQKKFAAIGGSAKMAAKNVALCVHMYWRMYTELC